MSQHNSSAGGLKSGFYHFVRFMQKSMKLENEWRRGILLMLEKDNDAKFLDCGCYQGEFTLMAAEKIGTSNITGIDVLEEMKDEVEGKGVKYRIGNLDEQLPFEDGSFDVICANQVIEHLSNTDNFLKEIYRILVDGGYAVISTPNLAACQNILSLIIGQQPFTANVSDEAPHAGTWLFSGDTSSGNSEISHRRVFTLKAICDITCYHGFTVEASTGSGYFPFSPFFARLFCRIDQGHAFVITVKIRKTIKTGDKAD